MPQYDAAIRNDRLSRLETLLGTSPIMRIYNGTMPATVDTALSDNTVLAEGTLPSDWAAAPSAGTMAKTETAWTLTGQSGAGAGTTGVWYALLTSGGVRKQQGPISELGLNSTTIATGQTVTISAATWTEGNP